VFANYGEAQRGANEVRNGYHGHGQFGADPRGQQRSQNAANPEAGDRRYGSRQDASAGNQERVIHDELVRWSVYSEMICIRARFSTVWDAYRHWQQRIK
jgi:hypothetical protein